MLIYSSEYRPRAGAGGFWACVALCVFATAATAHAQLTSVSTTFSAPRIVDGGAASIFLDLSSAAWPVGSAVSKTTLSIDFGKWPDLSDDPPYFSEIGVVLQKLDTTFTVLDQITLIEIGSFNDGAFGSFFNGSITFDDSAPSLVNANPDELASGTFRPEQPLSLLSGLFSPYYELRLVDAAYQNPLTFRSATLTLFGAGVAATVPVPEPGTFGLAGAVLVGLLVICRRRFSFRFD